MCRLFGLASGTQPVKATFWLLDAPDSMELESRRNVDGTGIGWFGADGLPKIDKQPVPAYRDADFIRDAVDAESTSFVAHVRWATAGERAVRNTHPFAMGGLVMAHNGGFGDLDVLDEQLGDHRALVKGETDSERYLALIVQQTEAHDGDVAAGIAAAAAWIGQHLPVSSLNTVVIRPGELWALRYPGTHALHVIERPAGAGATGESPPPTGTAGTGLHVRSSTSSVHSDDLHRTASVVVASEELDGESGWRMLDVGELLHVAPDLSVTSTVAVPNPPATLVALKVPNPNVDT
jgi:predicted glutamine amidotransferase